MNSSALSGYRYDNKNHVLHIHFVDASKYCYLNFPPEVWDEFNKSSSKGEFFNHHIRNKYETVLIENAPPVVVIPEVIALLEEALIRVKAGNIASASWRLADALGRLSDYIHDVEGSYSIEGINEPTGQGNQIVNVRDGLASLEE